MEGPVPPAEFLPPVAGAQFNKTFQMDTEGPTLANALLGFLHENPTVSFAAYNTCHFTEKRVIVRVQTDGRATAAQAMSTACDNLTSVCGHMRSQFQAAIRRYRKAQQPQEDADAVAQRYKEADDVAPSSHGAASGASPSEEEEEEEEEESASESQ